jgi:LPS-assembly protein
MPAYANTITAEHLEHFEKEDKYVGTGNVRIVRDGAVVTAEHAVLYNKTGDAQFVGNVVYEDETVIINTEKADLNIDKQTGTMDNALIFVKDRTYRVVNRNGGMIGVQGQRQQAHYWVYGEKVAKLAEDRFHAQRAIITTCDSDSCLNPEELKMKRYLGAPTEVVQASSPAWTINGNDVDVKVGDKITSKNTTVKSSGKTPIFYSPYFSAALGKERQTGFLMPKLGTSSLKGFMVNQPFYWALDDNKDVTLEADYMSKLGIGKRVQYRYLDFDGRGIWNAYHLYDTKKQQHYEEIRGSSDLAITQDIKAFADIRYINHRDFYQRLASNPNETSERFLQSTAQVSAYADDNNRFYLLGQYWMDLQRDQSHLEPQRLPELGYTLQPIKSGPFVIDMSSSIANFFRERNVRGQRFDIMPTISHSFGDEIRVRQSLSLREGTYRLTNDPEGRSSINREQIIYQAYAQSRFLKQYDSFTHILEPSVEYQFVSQTNSVPMFDSSELLTRASEVTFSLMNRLVFQSSQLLLRLSQPYGITSLSQDKWVQPSRLDSVYLATWGSISSDVSYSFPRAELDAVNSNISFRVSDATTVSFGERYNRIDRFMNYTVGFETNYRKRWFVGTTLSYDAKGQGWRDSTASLSYVDPCWALSTTVTRRPGSVDVPADYVFMLFFELKGLGAAKAL